MTDKGWAILIILALFMLCSLETFWLYAAIIGFCAWVYGRSMEYVNKDQDIPSVTHFINNLFTKKKK